MLPKGSTSGNSLEGIFFLKVFTILRSIMPVLRSKSFQNELTRGNIYSNFAEDIDKI